VLRDGTDDVAPLEHALSDNTRSPADTISVRVLVDFTIDLPRAAFTMIRPVK
jgi:hypothetical protein